MDSALLQPFENDTPYNLAFEDQSQIKSTAGGDTSDSDTHEQPNDATPILTASLSYAEENGQMFIQQFKSTS